MSDRAALYRSIIANPEEDTPRLVYADWLEENGRAEEAEFIRVECRLESGTPQDPEHTDLLDRQAELRMWLGTHVKGPELKFPARLKLDCGSHWWNQTCRGFPRFYEYEGYGRAGRKPMRMLAAALEKAFAKLPTRWLVVRFISIEQLAELLKQPVIAGLDRLTIQFGLNEEPRNDACHLISGSAHLKKLQGLALGFPFGDSGAESLARSSYMSQLRMLSVEPRLLTPSAARMFSAASWYGNLRSLSLNGNCPGDAFAELCGQNPASNLRSLALAENDFPVSVWQAFARSSAFPVLDRLDLERTDLSGERFTALAAARWLRLSLLDLSACAIGNDGAAEIASAPWATSLIRLQLGYNSLTSTGTNAITGCTRLGRLKYLELSNNTIGGQTLRSLTANSALNGLTTLRLNGIGGDGRHLRPDRFEQFLRELEMPKLRYLDLSDCPIGHKAARQLSGSQFHSLTRLELSGCTLTDAVVTALLETPVLQNLIDLDLSNNGLEVGVQPLTDRHTMPRLARCDLEENPIRADIARKLRRRPGILL